MSNIELNIILNDLGRMALAFGLAFPIGWERGQEAGKVGFRTLPLVAMAACGFSLILDPSSVDLDDRTRVMQGVIMGIGFIGGGAIVKNERNVRGLATAASIWTAGAIGLAVGNDKPNIAIVLCVTSVLSLLILGGIKKEKDDQER